MFLTPTTCADTNFLRDLHVPAGRSLPSTSRTYPLHKQMHRISSSPGRSIRLHSAVIPKEICILCPWAVWWCGLRSTHTRECVRSRTAAGGRRRARGRRSTALCLCLHGNQLRRKNIMIGSLNFVTYIRSRRLLHFLVAVPFSFVPIYWPSHFSPAEYPLSF
jgi:hypothetical protein